jgi:NhaA family Na+:H+ antiporter
MHEGELADVRRATLPIAAAVGGMLVPAALFLLLTRGAPDRSGWGVPMATDIAFAIGVLAVLGKRVPPALRVLLLALAIIDDIGAILVIAIFYSSKADPAGFAIAAAGVALVLLMQRIGVRRAIMYVPAGFLVWLGALRAGVHPTVAGVILGLMTPVSTWKSHESASPLVRLQKKLHVPVAFGIMPLFAFANAGVRLDGVTLSDASKPVLVGIIAGLVLGKPLGVVGATLLTTKLGIARLPEGVSMRHVVLLGIVAGIGFTMALFIGDLAYRDAELAAATKLAVLIASAAAGVLAIVAGRRLCRA